LIITEPDEDGMNYIDPYLFQCKAQRKLDDLYKNEFVNSDKYKELLQKLPENLIEYEFAT
jgi:hypothetical protein